MFLPAINIKAGPSIIEVRYELELIHRSAVLLSSLDFKVVTTNGFIGLVSEDYERLVL